MNRIGIAGWTLVAISALCLLVGVPCWVIADITPNHYQCDELVAVPLVPMTSDRRTYWTGAVPIENQTVYNNDSILEIILPMESYPERYIGRLVKVHALHNLFGFHFDVTLQGNTTIKRRHCLKTRNLAVGGSDSIGRKIHPYDLHEGLRSHGNFRVRCPYTTEVTRNAGIEPKCNTTRGYFMDLPSRYEDLVLFTFTPHDYTFPLKLVFDKLTVIPMDFIDPPQIFIGVWEVSNSEQILISGSVLTSSGLLILIVTVALFFAFYPNAPANRV